MQLRITQAWLPPERYRQASLHSAFAIPPITRLPTMVATICEEP
jgi:hypothetical protein